MQLEQEITKQFSSMWTIYMDFYVMFLTLNLVALGAVWEKIGRGPGRTIVCVAFMSQNTFGCCTAVGMAIYSARMAAGYPKGKGIEVLREIGWLGQTGGWACTLSMAVFTVMWFVMMRKVNTSADQQSEGSP